MTKSDREISLNYSITEFNHEVSSDDNDVFEFIYEVSSNYDTIIPNHEALFDDNKTESFYKVFLTYDVLNPTIKNHPTIT